MYIYLLIFKYQIHVKISILLLTLLVLFIGCEKQISITPPTIISLSNTETLGEELQFEVIEFADEVFNNT